MEGVPKCMRRSYGEHTAALRLGRQISQNPTFSHFSDNGGKSLRECSVIKIDPCASGVAGEDLSEFEAGHGREKLVTIGNYVKLGNFHGFFLGQDGLPVIE